METFGAIIGPIIIFFMVLLNIVVTIGFIWIGWTGFTHFLEAIF